MFEPYVNYQQQEFVARPAPPPPEYPPKAQEGPTGTGSSKAD